MIDMQYKYNRQSELREPLSQTFIDSRGQNNRLPSVDTQPTDMRDSLDVVRQTRQPHVTQRQRIAAAQDHLFYGRVAGDLIQSVGQPGRLVRKFTTETVPTMNSAGRGGDEQSPS